MCLPRDPTEAQIREMLRVPSDFSMRSGHPVAENPDTWTIGPGILTRDANLLEKSNCAALKKALTKLAEERPELARMWAIRAHTHFGFGWVEQLCFQLIDEKGALTPFYEWLYEWYAKLDDYPIADQDDLNEREYAATISNIGGEGWGLLNGEEPEEWEREVYRWFRDNDERAIENRSGEGGDPSREQMTKALRALGWLEEDEDE